MICVTVDTLPVWMRKSTTLPVLDNSAIGRARDRRNSAYIDRLLLRTAAIFKALLENNAANKRGLMQQVVPGARLAGTGLILLGCVVTDSLVMLFVIGLLIFFIALLSRVRPVTMLYRVAPVLIFTALVTAPALFYSGSIEAGGLGLGSSSFSIFGSVFTVTSGALYGYAFLLTRVTVMVSVTTLLLLTTSRLALFGVLRSLPGLCGFVTVLQMTVTHLLILLEDVHDAAMARKARTITAPFSRDLREWFASRIGLTLMRSLATAEEVSQAMVSRGLKGSATRFKSSGFSGDSQRVGAVGGVWLLFSFFLFFVAIGA